jgi:hypothetical protein
LLAAEIEQVFAFDPPEARNSVCAAKADEAHAVPPSWFLDARCLALRVDGRNDKAAAPEPMNLSQIVGSRRGALAISAQFAERPLILG